MECVPYISWKTKDDISCVLAWTNTGCHLTSNSHALLRCNSTAEHFSMLKLHLLSMLLVLWYTLRMDITTIGRMENKIISILSERITTKTAYISGFINYHTMLYTTWSVNYWIFYDVYCSAIFNIWWHLCNNKRYRVIKSPKIKSASY